MKTYASATTNHRAAGKVFVPVHLVRFEVRDENDDPAFFHFSSRDDDEEYDVIDPDTGGTVTRTYIGGGALVTLDPVTRSEGTGVRNFSVVLSGVHSGVLSMVLGHQCRGGAYQYHVAELDQDTDLPLDVAPHEFIGFIDTIGHEDAALALDGAQSADSLVTVSVSALGSALQNTNQDMRTLSVSKTRSSDEIFKYAGSAHHWSVRWGKESKSEKDRRGGGDKGGTGAPVPGWSGR